MNIISDRKDTDEIIPIWKDTYLQGYITISFNDIVKKLGKPITNVHWKITARWCGTKIIDDGNNKIKSIVYTIYDYKDQDRERNVRPWQFYMWHIGGHGKRALDVVRELFPDAKILSEEEYDDMIMRNTKNRCYGCNEEFFLIDLERMEYGKGRSALYCKNCVSRLKENKI